MVNGRDPSETAGRLALSPAGIIGMGVLAAAAGVLVLAWPKSTLQVLAVIFALFVLIHGVFRLVAALAVDELSGGGRVLLALLGMLSILIGVLCLRHPFQTLTVLVLLLGLYWILSGVLETVHALGSPGLPGRGWVIGGGVVSVAAGIVVLAVSSATLIVLAWLVGLQLLCYGAITVARGIQARHDLRAVTPAKSKRRTGSRT